MRLKRGESVPPLTVDELQFAMASADAAYQMRTPVKAMSERTRPIRVGDDTICLTDIPLNHAAMSLLDALGHDRAKAWAALWRVMMIGLEVFKHKKAEKWVRPAPDDPKKEEVHGALIEAIATVPANYMGKTDAMRVFRLAEKIAGRET
jgi:hypothetical protein